MHEEENTGKGISLTSFSITDNKTYQSFNKIPEPPIGVFCDIRIGKKSSLKSVYYFEQILQSAQKPKVEQGQVDLGQIENGN
jgi:hypothetical protein